MLGKTRQPTDAGAASQTASPTPPEIRETLDAGAGVGKARGVLKAAPPGQGVFCHMRRAAAPDLARFVDHYWMVSWDLEGSPPRAVETLTHPNFHLVSEAGKAEVAGVFTGRFTRMLEGRSRVFGIKFTPGGFRAFLPGPASALANRTVPAAGIFGAEVDRLAQQLAESDTEPAQIAAAESFLRERIPPADPDADLAALLVRRILDEPEIRTVDDLAGRSGMGKRSLQRLFQEYVGVAPKWVIRRYRLHELLERAHAGDPPDWAQTAVDLGYFDQAHLINDFRSIVGCTPTAYQARSGSS